MVNTCKNNKIPKIVHQIWIGREMPEIIKLYTNDWKKMKGWDYRLWNNKDLNKENFPLTWFILKKLINRKNPIYAMISDLMRLEILFHHGGVYLDVNIEKKKNLNKLLDHKDYRFVISNELPDPNLELIYISNSFIASVPKHIILKRLLDYQKLSQINFNKQANHATGPYYLRTGIYNKNEITYIPSKLIYPFKITYIKPDKCVSYNKIPGFKEYKYDDNKIYYIKFPCTSYNKSYMIKHWDIGGSWINKILSAS